MSAWEPMMSAWYGMPGREQPVVELLVGQPVGRVVVVLPPLVADDGLLGGQALLVEPVEQEPHPVALQPQGQLELVGRDVGDDVVRVVEAGAGVLRRAGAPPAAGRPPLRGRAPNPRTSCARTGGRSPVRPASSLAGPTWYQRLTATTGRRLSWRRMTSSPLPSTYFSVRRSKPGDGSLRRVAAARQEPNADTEEQQENQARRRRLRPLYSHLSNLRARADQTRPVVASALRHGVGGVRPDFADTRRGSRAVM